MLEQAITPHKFCDMTAISVTNENLENHPEDLTLRVLVVDDDNNIRSACSRIFAHNKADTVCAETLLDAEAQLHDRRFDLLLLDLKLPDGSGIALLEKAKNEYPDMAVVVMTAFATVSSAVEAMRIGASDYLTKPFAMEELVVILQRAQQRAKFKDEGRILRERLCSQNAESGLIGRSYEMEKLYRIISRVAFSTHPILILGERGTGKEVLARSIHSNGPNSDKPFLHADCSFPSIEHLLFGTGQPLSSNIEECHDSVLAAVEGGTLYLDEIDELSPELQARLLRVLQEKKLPSVGGSPSKTVSMRVVASSSGDLVSMVEQGKFRKDLFFRLNVVNLKVPALRERKEDIALLAIHFLAIQDKKDGIERTLSEEVFRLFEKYEWPSNVRELENAIEHACAVSTGSLLKTSDLPHPLRAFQIQKDIKLTEDDTFDLSTLEAEAVTREGDIVPIAEMEKQAILGTIRQLGGDKLMAARLLGIGKTTLYRKLKEYELSDLTAESLISI